MWLASHAAVQLNIQLNCLKECLLLIKFVIKLKTVTKKVDKHPNLISHNRESDSNNVSAVTSKNIPAQLSVAYPQSGLQQTIRNFSIFFRLSEFI